MAKLRATNIDPKTATTLTLGASGDAVTVSSTELRANTFKDAGGNTLWTSDGSGTLSSVNSSLAGGGMTLLATYTPSSVSNVDITANLTNAYIEYWFVLSNFTVSAANCEFRTQFKQGGSYGVNHFGQAFEGYNPESGSSGATVQTQPSLAEYNNSNYMGLGRDITSTSSTAAVMTGILKLFDPAGAATRTKWSSELMLKRDSGGPGPMATWAGGFIGAAGVVDGITFATSSGTFSGTIQHYGIG